MKRNKKVTKKKARKLIPVIVNRNRWFRGGGDGSALRLKSGKMCCLGFVGRELGIPAKRLVDVPMPRHCISGDVEKFATSTKLIDTSLDVDSDVCVELAETNDLQGLSEKVRESRIITKGKKAGIAFKFTG